MRLARLLICGSLVAGLVFSGTPALAKTAHADDPDDTTGPLDIKTASVNYTKKVMKFTIITWEELDSTVLEQPNNAIYLAFAKKDGTIHHYVIVNQVSGTLLGKLYSGDTVGEGTYQRDVEVDKNFLIYPRVTIKKSWVGYKGVKKRYFGFLSSFYDDADCADGCLDYAPDLGNAYTLKM